LKNFNYKILYSNEIDSNLEKEIMECFNSSFNQKKSKKYFKWKYFDNPFGHSIHILVYDKLKLVSSRAFWRLDLNQQEAYQCVDTSVIPSYQGKGIFKLSTNAALKILKNKIIYNYPNKMSYPAYLNLGWDKNKLSFLKFNYIKKAFPQIPFINWSLEKLIWRFVENPQIKYYSTFLNGYYLILRKRKGFYVVLAKTHFDLNLKNVNPKVVFSYDNNFKGCKIPGKKILTLSRNLDLKKVPFFNYDMM